MEFNYFYDFEDCFQLDLSGNPITYVVGSNGPIDITASYSLYPISEPNFVVCGNYITASTSTAATYYVDITMKYVSCNSCLSATTQVISVSGISKPNLSNINFIADIRYKKGDIVHIDLVYDDSGDLIFINSPAVITQTSPYVSTGSTIPQLVGYVPYNSFQQVIESKGLYYSVEDCSDGTISTVLSQQYFEKFGQIINAPFGNSPCKKVLSAVTTGDYSLVSGGTPIVKSSRVYDTCDVCKSIVSDNQVFDDFNQNSYTLSSINTINQFADGTILIGGSGFTHVSGSSLYNVGNMLRLDPFGELILDFNANQDGSLSLYNNNFIYTDYREGFNFEGDFTIELWFFYVTKNSDTASLISFYDNESTLGWDLRFNGLNQLQFVYNDVQLNFKSYLNIIQWNHIALVRNSGTIKLYINGVADENSYSSINDNIYSITSSTLNIGTNFDKTTFIDGYVSNVRICKLSVYTGDFTPQTTPLQITQGSFGNVSSIPSSATTLLMSFKNLSQMLYDSSLYSTQFYSYNPSVSYITYSPVKDSNLTPIYDSEPLNSFVELDLPEGFELSVFGTKISTVYIGTNSYLTFEQGSNDGGIVLPDDIPSINSSGLFISTFGNGLNNDNDTYIRKISTGYTDGDEALTVRVEGGYKNLRTKNNQQPCCNCYTLKNISINDVTVQFQRCDTNEIDSFVALSGGNGYDFCSRPYIIAVETYSGQDVITPLYRFKAYKAQSTQTINTVSNNTSLSEITVNFNYEEYDENNNFNLNTDEYEAPLDGGTYTFEFKLLIGLTNIPATAYTYTTLTVSMRKFDANSGFSSVLGTPITYEIPYYTGYSNSLNHTFEPVQLNAGDRVKLVVRRRVYNTEGFQYSFNAQNVSMHILSESFTTNNFFRLSNVEGLPAIVLPQGGVVTVVNNGYCAKLSDEPESHWICGEDYDISNGCDGVSVCTENIANNSQFQSQTFLGINQWDIYIRPEYGGDQGIEVFDSGWVQVPNTPFGSVAEYIAGPQEDGNVYYLEQNILELGAEYQISFDMYSPRNCSSFGPNPYYKRVRVYAGWAQSELFYPSSFNTNGGLERFETTLISSGTRLRFRVLQDNVCEEDDSVYITNVCVIQTAPPPICNCYRVIHENPSAPASQWFLFQWRDCSGNIHQQWVGGSTTLYPCIRENSYSFLPVGSGLGTNAGYAIVESLDETCLYGQGPYCIETISFDCLCYELKLGNNQSGSNTVEFLDCDGNYRFITNTFGPGVTLSDRFCLTSIISNPGALIERGLCVENTPCTLDLADPIPPTSGCTVMLNSDTDPYDVYMYDVENNEIITVTLQGPYIFNNADSEDEPYTDIAISIVSNRFYFSNSSFILETGGGETIVQPTTYLGYFNIDFSAGTYVSGSTINVTPAPPFFDAINYDFNLINHGLEVSLDGYHIYTSSYGYNEDEDVQSIILCDIIEPDPTNLNLTETTCIKLFDLLPGRRVQGDITRTSNGKLLITTTDDVRVYLEQWYTDDTEQNSIFEFEIVLRFVADSGVVTNLSVGPSQIDVFVYNEELYISDNNFTPTRLFRLINEYPYNLVFVNEITELGIIGKFNGAASFPTCNSFSLNYPDTRCRPLILFSGNSGQVQVSQFNFLPFQPLSFIDLGLYPALTNLVNYEIAHTYNFETNTGKMWILGRGNVIFDGSFREWDITGVLQPNGEIAFTVEYIRNINIELDTNQNPILYRFHNGFTVVDNNTFIIGCRDNLTPPRGHILQINIPVTTGNLNLDYSDVTYMFRLPIPGDQPQQLSTLANPLLVSTDMTYTVDNKLIMTASLSTTGGPSPAQKWILQYPYAIDAIPEFFLQTANSPFANLGPINYNSEVFIWRRVGTTPGTPWNGYVVNNEPPFNQFNYLDITSNFVANLPCPAGFNVKGASSVSISSESTQTCNTIRFEPNLPTVIPTLTGCPVFLNSNLLEGIWFYNPDDNSRDAIILPQLGEIAETVYSYRDIAVCNTNNRLYASISTGGNAFSNDLIMWGINFPTGTLVSGPTLIPFPAPSNFNALRLGEGLEVSPNGDLIYRSVTPIEGSEDSNSRILIWDLSSDFNPFNYQELIIYTNGRRVKGDIIRTSNGKLFVSTTNGTTIFIEQWSTDDTLVGTTLDGEIEFGPDIYSSFDIFIRTDGTNPSEFFAVSSLEDTSTLWSISVELEITEVFENTNLQRVVGAASYPACNSFEFDFPNPRCRPLLVFSGGGFFGVTRWDGIVQSELLEIDLGTTYPAPPPSSRFSMKIAHLFDFNTNTGWMWISQRAVTAATTMSIWEWSIDDEDFNVTYNRRITVSPTGSTFRHHSGIAAKDRNTLIIEAWSGSAPMSNSVLFREFIGELDITPGLGNNLSYADNLTLMFRLPAPGDPLYTRSYSMMVWNGFYLGPNNRLVIFGRDGENLADSLPKFLVQYEYVQSTDPSLFAIPEVFYQYPDPALPSSARSNHILTYEGQILMARITFAPCFGCSFSRMLLDQNSYIVTSGILAQYLSPALTYGPWGASSINSSPEGIAICEPVIFEPNIITTDILPNCPVFFVSNTAVNLINGNMIYWYDIENNTAETITLPNAPTGLYREIAFSQASDRLYLLHGDNPQSPILTYWTVDFITGFIAPTPVSVTLSSPFPTPSGGVNFIVQGLSTDLAGTSVFMTWRTGSVTNFTETIVRYNTINSTYFTDVNNSIQLPPQNTVSGDIVVTNNGKILVTYREGNDHLIGQWSYNGVNPVTQEYQFEIASFVQGVDIFMTSDNELFAVINPLDANFPLSILKINIDGTTELFSAFIETGRIVGCGSSSSCYSFSFQSECDPLLLWFGPSTQTYRLAVSRYDLSNSAPVLLDLGTSYSPSTLGTTLLETYDIAHTFDFNTNTGLLWIKKVVNGNNTHINEWIINDLFYNLTWNRLITLNTSNNGGLLTRFDQGMAYVAPNTLVLGAYVGTGWNVACGGNCGGRVFRVNITNNTLTIADCSLLYKLPVVGDPGYSGTSNLLLYGSMYYANNSIVMICKYGNAPLTSVRPNYIVQYPYESLAQPELIKELNVNYTQPAAPYPMTVNGQVFIVRNQSTNWGLQRVETGLPFGLTTIHTTIPFVNQGGNYTGPFGVSSIDPSEYSEQYCEPVGLISNLCETCDLHFDYNEDYNIGKIVVGNLVGSCQSNISDFVIFWYGPNNTTEVAFTSGLGNVFNYDYQHPLTGSQSPIVGGGEYTPVIDKIIIGGVTYSQTGGTEFLTSPLNCFQSINVVCADCTNSNSSDPDYSYEFSFNGAVAGVQTPPFSACLDLPSSVDYIAWAFSGYSAFDNLRVIYTGQNYNSEVILDNWNIGIDTTPNYTWTDFEKSANYNSWKRVICLTGLTRSYGNESIIFQITSPTGDSNWSLKFECLETFDCSLCILEEPTGDLFKIDSTGVTATTQACSIDFELPIIVCEEALPLFNGTDFAKYTIPNFAVYFNNVMYVGGIVDIDFIFPLTSQRVTDTFQPILYLTESTLECSEFNTSTIITYSRFNDGNDWIVEVKSNQQYPINDMYTSYLNIMNSDSEWGYSGCSGSSGLPFSGATGQTDNMGTFSGGTSSNGIPSYLDNTDYRYYRYMYFLIPTASGTSSCLETSDTEQVGWEGDLLNGRVKVYRIHPSASVTTGFTDNNYYMTIQNYELESSNFNSCITYIGLLDGLVQAVNNQYDNGQFITATTQTGSYFLNSFVNTFTPNIGCQSISSYVAMASAGLYTYANNTLPFTTNGQSIPSSSAMTCNLTNTYLISSAFFEEAEVSTRYYYTINSLGGENFEVYATPIVNGEATPPDVLALVYSGGSVTYSDPTYVV